MSVHTVDRFSDRRIREGELVFGSAVRAANLLRDFREHITNTFGGRMARYNALLQETINEALEQLEENARARGYDGVVAVRISHPSIVDGGVEVVVYGTGFNYAD